MKEIKDFPNYSVTPNGKVISNGRIAGRSGKGFSSKKIELAILYNQRGYCMVNLFNNRKQKTKYVHRLVAEAFLPNPENLPQINHIDGNKENNDVSNLEWCTSKHNNVHALENGLRKGQKGETNSQAKVTEKQVISIIEDILNGLSNIEIAVKFDLHDRYISLIRGKKRWKYLWENKFSEIENIPESCRKRTKAFKAQRLSQLRVGSSESKREDSKRTVP
ncbi:HNH endonuclease [Thiovulum sp. ES]|nr:HNH endonuclease [Thiovulum sp. ES]